MVLEGQPKPLLWVATPQRLIAIDMSKLKINHYEDASKLKINHYESRDFEIHSLPVFRMLNLVENEFPFGMRFFIRDSKLYMVGGEKPRRGASPKLYRHLKCVGHDESFGDRGLSPYVYVLDLTRLDSSTDLDLLKHHTSMLAAKPTPIVEEIEGKIYVLSGTPSQSYCLLPTPTFEVYDPLIEQWKPLDQPPFYREGCSNCQEFEVIDHSVLGTTIYVLTFNLMDEFYHYYSYNVNDGNWKFLGESEDKLPVPYHFTPTFTGKFVPGYNDIYIFFLGDIPYAALIPSNDRSPTRYQALNEVDGALYHRQVASYSGLVVQLGEHEMCIMKPGSVQAKEGSLRPCHIILYMATFKVEKLLHSSSSAQDRGLKLLRTVDASDVSQTSSHHDNGNCACHYTLRPEL